MTRYICCLFPIKNWKKHVEKGDLTRSVAFRECSTDCHMTYQNKLLKRKEGEKLYIIEPYIKEIREGVETNISWTLSDNKYPDKMSYHLARLQMEKKTMITDTCPVCLEEFTIKQPIRNCSHKYHDRCVDNKICPICSRLIYTPEGVDNDDEFYVKFNLLRKKYANDN